MNLLLSVVVLASTFLPLKGAIIRCEGVPTYGEDDSGDGGEWAPTDSAGKMFFEAPAGRYYCYVRREGYQNWSGWLTYSTTHKKEEVILAPLPS